MGLAYTPESAYAQEMVKHEALHTRLGPPGRPYTHQDYPMRLYLAGRNQSGVPGITHAVTVADEHERRNMESRGYRAGQDVALEHLHASDREIAELAANRGFHDRRMSDKARREAAAADDASPHHLPVIPEKPKPPRRKPGPKAKEVAHHG